MISKRQKPEAASPSPAEKPAAEKKVDPALAQVYLEDVPLLDSPQWSSDDELDNPTYNKRFRHKKHEEIRQKLQQRKMEARDRHHNTNNNNNPSNKASKADADAPAVAAAPSHSPAPTTAATSVARQEEQLTTSPRSTPSPQPPATAGVQTPADALSSREVGQPGALTRTTTLKSKRSQQSSKSTRSHSHRKGRRSSKQQLDGAERDEAQSPVDREVAGQHPSTSAEEEKGRAGDAAEPVARPAPVIAAVPSPPTPPTTAAIAAPTVAQPRKSHSRSAELDPTTTTTTTTTTTSTEQRSVASTQRPPTRSEPFPTSYDSGVTGAPPRPVSTARPLSNLSTLPVALSSTEVQAPKARHSHSPSNRSIFAHLIKSSSTPTSKRSSRMGSPALPTTTTTTTADSTPMKAAETPAATADATVLSRVSSAPQPIAMSAIAEEVSARPSGVDAAKGRPPKPPPPLPLPAATVAPAVPRRAPTPRALQPAAIASPNASFDDGAASPPLVLDSTGQFIEPDNASQEMANSRNRHRSAGVQRGTAAAGPHTTSALPSAKSPQLPQHSAMNPRGSPAPLAMRRQQGVVAMSSSPIANAHGALTQSQDELPVGSTHFLNPTRPHAMSGDARKYSESVASSSIADISSPYQGVPPAIDEGAAADLSPYFDYMGMESTEPTRAVAKTNAVRARSVAGGGVGRSSGSPYDASNVVVDAGGYHYGGAADEVGDADDDDDDDRFSAIAGPEQRGFHDGTATDSQSARDVMSPGSDVDYILSYHSSYYGALVKQPNTPLSRATFSALGDDSEKESGSEREYAEETAKTGGRTRRRSAPSVHFSDGTPHEVGFTPRETINSARSSASSLERMRNGYFSYDLPPTGVSPEYSYFERVQQQQRRPEEMARPSPYAMMMMMMADTPATATAKNVATAEGPTVAMPAVAKGQRATELPRGPLRRVSQDKAAHKSNNTNRNAPAPPAARASKATEQEEAADPWEYHRGRKESWSSLTREGGVSPDHRKASSSVMTGRFSVLSSKKWAATQRREEKKAQKAVAAAAATTMTTTTTAAPTTGPAAVRVLSLQGPVYAVEPLHAESVEGPIPRVKPLSIEQVTTAQPVNDARPLELRSPVMRKTTAQPAELTPKDEDDDESDDHNATPREEENSTTRRALLSVDQPPPPPPPPLLFSFANLPYKLPATMEANTALPSPPVPTKNEKMKEAPAETKRADSPHAYLSQSSIHLSPPSPSSLPPPGAISLDVSVSSDDDHITKEKKEKVVDGGVAAEDRERLLQVTAPAAAKATSAVTSEDKPPAANPLGVPEGGAASLHAARTITGGNFLAASSGPSSATHSPPEENLHATSGEVDRMRSLIGSAYLTEVYTSSLRLLTGHRRPESNLAEALHSAASMNSAHVMAEPTAAIAHAASPTASDRVVHAPVPPAPQRSSASEVQKSNSSHTTTTTTSTTVTPPSLSPPAMTKDAAPLSTRPPIFPPAKKSADTTAVPSLEGSSLSSTMNSSTHHRQRYRRRHGGSRIESIIDDAALRASFLSTDNNVAAPVRVAAVGSSRNSDSNNTLQYLSTSRRTGGGHSMSSLDDYGGSQSVLSRDTSGTTTHEDGEGHLIGWRNNNSNNSRNGGGASAIREVASTRSGSSFVRMSGAVPPPQPQPRSHDIASPHSVSSMVRRFEAAGNTASAVAAGTSASAPPSAPRPPRAAPPLVSKAPVPTTVDTASSLIMKDGDAGGATAAISQVSAQRRVIQNGGAAESVNAAGQSGWESEGATTMPARCAPSTLVAVPPGMRSPTSASATTVQAARATPMAQPQQLTSETLTRQRQQNQDQDIVSDQTMPHSPHQPRTCATAVVSQRDEPPSPLGKPRARGNSANRGCRTTEDLLTRIKIRDVPPERQDWQHTSMVFVPTTALPMPTQGSSGMPSLPHSSNSGSDGIGGGSSGRGSRGTETNTPVLPPTTVSNKEGFRISGEMLNRPPSTQKRSPDRPFAVPQHPTKADASVQHRAIS